MKKIMTLVVSAALAFFASASLLAAAKEKYTVTIDKNVEGCKSVSFESKQFTEGAKATIKAVADKGYVFAGWNNDGVLNEDPRSATATFTVDTDYDFTPSFVKIGDDYLNFEETSGYGFFDPAYPLIICYEVGEEVSGGLELPSCSFPTVSFKGLPAGVKFDAKTLNFSGKATKAGIYPLSMSIKNASGYTTEMFGFMTVEYPEGVNVSFAESADLVPFDAEKPFDSSYLTVGKEITPISDFIVDGSEKGFKSIKVSGLPAGLKYDVVGNTLSGTPTKAGDYAIVATVKFLDATLPDETISMLVRVLPEEFWGEPLIDSGVLMVGMEGGTRWGKYPKGIKIVAKGLPAGLKVVKDTDDSEWDYFSIEGTPTKAGDYLVTFTETKGSDKYEYSYVFHVQPAPSFYLDVQSADEEMGTVTGAGVYQYNTKKVTIKATPKSGYSFSYWHEVYSSWEYCYSDASMSETADWFVYDIGSVSDWEFSLMTANFIAKTDDYCELDLNDSGDSTWDLGNNSWGRYIAAISGSKATVTAKGLPAGIKLYDDEDMSFNDDDGRIWQDWYLKADWTKVKPGTYDVQLSAKNLSGKADQTKTLTIIVPGKSFSEIIPSWGYEFALDAGVKYDVPANYICDAVEGVKLTAKDLPAGLKFTQKDGAYYFTGTPTKGGSFPVILTAKWYNFTAETTVMVTVNMPEVSVQNYCDTEEGYTGDVCGKTTGAGYYQAGKKVTLKATASSDHVFSGWWNADTSDYVDFDFAGVDFRSPSISFVMGTGDYNLEACFVEKADDIARGCKISLEGEEFGQDITLNADKTNLTIAAGAPYVLDVLADSYSLPTFKVKGLPAGLKFDAKTATITGVPTKAGTFTVTVDATNVSKAKDQFVFAVTVLPVADWAVGTFNGGIGENGIFTATVKNTGAISGKVTINGKSASFSAKNFDFVEVVGFKHKNNSVSWRSLDSGRIGGKATGSTTRLGQVAGGAALTANGSFEFWLDPEKDFEACDPFIEEYFVEVTVKIDGNEVVLPLRFAELNRTIAKEDPANQVNFEDWNGERYTVTSSTFRNVAGPAITRMSNAGDDIEANVPAGATYWVEGAQLGCCYCSDPDLFIQSTQANFDAKKGYALDSVVKSSHDIAQIKEQLARYGAEFVSLTKAGVLKIKGPDGKSYTTTIAVTDVVVDGKNNYTEFVAPVATKDEGVIPLCFFVGEHDPS